MLHLIINNFSAMKYGKFLLTINYYIWLSPTSTITPGTEN
jgi:hypothetical protein